MKYSPALLLKFYKNLSIRNKLVLTLFAQILIPLFLIGFLSYKNSESIIKENSTNYSRDILNLIQLRLDDYMDNLTKISQDLLYEDKIYTALKSSNDTGDPIKKYEYEETVNSHLKMVVISRPEIRSICIFSNDGRVYYQDDNTKEAGSVKDIPYGDMLEKARRMGGKPYIYIVSENKKAKAIYLARQINDRDRFGELGLLVIKVKTELLGEVYQGLTGNLQNIMILSSDMDLIASRVNDELTVYSGMLADIIVQPQLDQIKNVARIIG
jgi:two-component system sensor histidine kinase YesM